MALVDVFIKGPEREKLDLSTVKRFPYLVWTNIILLAFFVFASYSRFKVDTVKYLLFFIIILATSAVYPVSIVLLRFARLKIASFISTQAMLVNLMWMGVFLPFTGAVDLYRMASMTMAAIIANSLIAFGGRQVVVFAAETTVFFVGFAAISAARLAFNLDSDVRTALFVSIILIVCVNLMILLIRRHSADILKLAESEMLHNRDKLEELRGLVRGAQGSFEIGGYLKKRADESMVMFSSIEKGLDRINEEARSLAKNAAKCREANGEILSFADSMKNSVFEQNSSLDETSASIHEIVATIDNIGRISRDKQGGIRGLVDDLDSKRGTFKSAREEVARIDRTSARVAEALGAIVDISERLNLLAMNASIEAAHLGAAGKGFGVISQEMRALSDRTMSSAKEIDESLKANADAVSGASKAIVGFTDEIEKVNDECRKALDGIDEILNGIQEISIGNREIQEATVNLVDISKKTESSVGSVMSRMAEEDEAIIVIDSFARELSAKIEAIDAEFKGIRALMGDLDAAGTRNMENIGELKAGMETAGRS